MMISCRFSRREKLSRKIFFVVAISEMVGDDDTAVELSS
jgi:hypothetical protein